MDGWKIVAEVCGVVATVIAFLIFQQKDRGRILMMKLACDVLWLLHFLLLGAYSGMVLSIVAAAREIVFRILDRRGKKRSILWLFLFLAANLILVLSAWNSPWSLCSLISGQLATLAFWQSSPHRTKIFSLFVCLSQLTYALAVGSYAAVGNELITLASIGIFFFRYFYTKRNRKESES